jgi:hypothetical protein
MEDDMVDGVVELEWFSREGEVSPRTAALSSQEGPGNPEDHHFIPTSITGTCPICISEYSNPVMLTACMHSFCLKCIQYWITHLGLYGKTPSCPLCKNPATEALQDITSPSQFQVIDLLVPAQQHRGRHLVYSHDLRIEEEPDHPTPYKTWAEMQPWLDRELSVVLGLTPDDPTLELVRHVVRPLWEEDAAPDRWNALLGSFMFTKTDVFVREARCFGASRLNMSAYDGTVRYTRPTGPLT